MLEPLPANENAVLPLGFDSCDESCGDITDVDVTKRGGLRFAVREEEVIDEGAGAERLEASRLNDQTGCVRTNEEGWKN